MEEPTLEPEELRLAQHVHHLNKRRQSVQRVLTEEGVESDNSRDIERIFYNYFANIYASKTEWEDLQRVQETQCP